MKNDDIPKIATADELITTYGSFLLSSHGLRKGNLISQRMRLLARLLGQLRIVTGESCDMIGFMLPMYFDKMVEAAKKLGGYSISTMEGEAISTFDIPALPLKIGYALDKCIQICKGIGIKKGDNNMVQNAERVSELFKLEWRMKISSVAIRTQATNKFNKVQSLPTTEDLLTVWEYLMKEIPMQTAKLTEKPDQHMHRKCQEHSLFLSVTL